MEEIINKYSQKLEDFSRRDATFSEVVSLNKAKLLLRQALEEYKHIYKEDRRFDFWGNEIY
jgi:hypothetical protein